jgi:hypothetical protein
METMNTSDGPMWVNVLRFVSPWLQSGASKNVPPPLSRYASSSMVYHSFSLYCFGLITGLYWCNQLTAWYDQTNGPDDGFGAPWYLFPIWLMLSHLIQQFSVSLYQSSSFMTTP